MSSGCETLQSHECVPRRSERDFPRRRRSPLLLLWAPKAVQGDTPPLFFLWPRDTLGFPSWDTHVITHTAALDGVRFQNNQEGGGGSSGKRQRFFPQVMLLTEGFFLVPSCWWHRCTRLPPPTTHKAKPSLEQSSHAWCNQSGEESDPPSPADNKFIHLFLGRKDHELSYSSWSSVVSNLTFLF